MKNIIVFLALLLASFGASAQTTLTPNMQFQLPAYNQVNWQVPISYNFALLDSALAGSAVLPTGTTPLVTQIASWTTQNTVSTAITNFQGGFPGQTLTLFCDASDTFTTISSGANIFVPAPFSCNTSSSITLRLLGSVWTEITSTSQVLGGTVTSVDLTVPAWLTVGGSPVTGAGTLAVTPTAAQTSHQVIGTCATTTTFAPCTLTMADLPSFFYQSVQNNGSAVTQRPSLDFIPSTNMTIVCGDDSVNNRTNCTFSATSTAATAWSGITAATNSNAGTFSASGNTWNFNNSTKFLLRSSAGLTTSPAGDIGYDVTNGNWHGSTALGDAIIPVLSNGFVSGNCGQPALSGTTWTIADSGAPCGSGGATGALKTVYNTVLTAGAGANIGAHTMATVGGTDTNYMFNVQIAQVNTSAGCASSPHVTATIAYTQAQTNIARNSIVSWASDNGAYLSTSFFILPLNSAPINNVVGWGQSVVRAKAGTSISISTAYTSGSCSTEASYSISPNLVQE